MFTILVVLVGLLKAEPTLDPQGDPLPAGAIARLGSARLGHGRIVHSMAFAPDGKNIASVGDDGVLCVWDTANGRLVRQWKASKIPVGRVVISPDSKGLVTVNEKGKLRAWSAATGQLRFEGKCLAEVVPVFSADGKELAIPVSDFKIDYVDATTGKVQRSVASRAKIATLALSFDGKYLALGDDGYQVRLFDPQTGKQLRTYRVNVGPVTALAFSPDGKGLATGTERGELSIWDTESEEALVTLTEDPCNIVGLRFAAQGTELFALDRQSYVRRYNARTGKLIERIGNEFSSGNYPPILSPDRKWIAYSDASRVRLVELATGTEREVAGSQPSFVDAVWSPEGTLVGLKTKADEMVLWRPGDPAPARRLPLAKGLAFVATLSADGKYVASTGAADQPLRIWETANGKEFRAIPFGDTPVPLAFAPVGRLLAVKNETTFGVVDVETGKFRWTQEVKAPGVGRVWFSADGRTLLVLNLATLQFLEAGTGKTRRRVELDISVPQSLLGLSMSPDGKILVASDNTGGVLFLDLNTGKQLRRLREPDVVLSVAISPGGKVLATGGQTGAVVLWDMATGDELARLAHGDRTTVAFSPDGKHLLTASYDETALVWDLAVVLAQATKVTPRPKADLWADLGSDDGERTFAAVLELTRRPAEAIALFQLHLKPVPGVEAGAIGRWIADLDSDTFDKREAAQKELLRLDRLAEPALRKAMAAKPSIEAGRRIDEILSQIDVTPTNAEVVRIFAPIEVLEAIGAEASGSLEALSRGAPDARLTQEARAALERIQRRATLPR